MFASKLSILILLLIKIVNCLIDMESYLIILNKLNKIGTPIKDTLIEGFLYNHSGELDLIRYNKKFNIFANQHEDVTEENIIDDHKKKGLLIGQPEIDRISVNF